MKPRRYHDSRGETSLSPTMKRSSAVPEMWEPAKPLRGVNSVSHVRRLSHAVVGPTRAGEV